MPYQTVGAQHSPIAGTGTGDNTIVANVTSGFDADRQKRIVVLRYKYRPAVAVVAEWKDSNGNVLSGAATINTNGDGGSYCEAGHFKTDPGADLILNLGDPVLCGGDVTYQYAAQDYD